MLIAVPERDVFSGSGSENADDIRNEKGTGTAETAVWNRYDKQKEKGGNRFPPAVRHPAQGSRPIRTPCKGY
jgi:hypothetical protein